MNVAIATAVSDCTQVETGGGGFSGVVSPVIPRQTLKKGLYFDFDISAGIFPYSPGAMDFRGIFRNATGSSVTGKVSGNGSGAFQAPPEGYPGGDPGRLRGGVIPQITRKK